MKALSFIFLILLSANSMAQFDIKFDQYFVDQTLRVDYYHTGDAKEEIFTLDKIYKLGNWAGNPKKCIQDYNMGSYFVKLYDLFTNQLIFSKGYSTLFSEYQTIGLAIKGIKRTYHETVLIPCPKRSFLFVIEKRNKNNLLGIVYYQKMDPNDYHIITEQVKRQDDEVISLVKNGNPHQKVDLVILAEGYTITEKDKFKKDLKYYVDLFFSIEPYKSRYKLFNINAVYTPSDESGTDEPRQGRYRKTVFSSSFNTFDTDRYLTDDDNKSIRDEASQVPYDAILIMVNLDRYGGGGIYNGQTVFATGSPWRDYVFLHEFGHAFAGLGDEYFSKQVAYEDLFVPGVEPLEPNITALLDTANLKWKEFVSPGIKIPTPWGKEIFDSLNLCISKLVDEKAVKIESLSNLKASIDEITKVENEYNTRIAAVNLELDKFLDNHPLKDKIGAFEGASYQSKGLYRPTIMSMMHKFDKKDRSYKKVNEQAIINVINYYTEE